ncbi:MAG: molybdopterin converting factor subunit 1 [Rhodospirillales bacterium]|nr:molybdopterin converting factor subunit 1 [Rhodospirillales bacterium]
MRILYFAWVREQAGCAAEDVALPATVVDVAGLVSWLRSRGGGSAQALANLGVIRVAVNQEYVPFDHPVAPDDEVAFFPPVTGG